MKITDEELTILLDDLVKKYGYDFNFYSKPSITRRINRLFELDKFQNFDAFRRRINSETNYIKRFIEEITVNVTEMFRDNSFYRELRATVVPSLANNSFIRIWCAGCSTGEEVYSVAIILQEAGLLGKSLIYATDINPAALEKARTGIFPLSSMKLYSANYIASGGRQDFSSYYSANYQGAILNEDIKRKVVFSTHNLVSDSSFNEFDLIMCRNVLIYFDRELQERVFTLFDSSLKPKAFLALGSKETLKFSEIQNKYSQVLQEKIWKKIK